MHGSPWHVRQAGNLSATFGQQNFEEKLSPRKQDLQRRQEITSYLFKDACNPRQTFTHENGLALIISEEHKHLPPLWLPPKKLS